MNTRNYVIVVGVDGSEGSRQALLWALHEARARGGSVQAVNAWHWDFPELRDPGTAEREAQRAEGLLASEIDALPAGLMTGVPVACEAIEGKPADVLTGASRSADLLVLGSHGRSQQIHKLLGSVSEECLRNASCAVVVIPISFQNRQVPGKPAQELSRS